MTAEEYIKSMNYAPFHYRDRERANKNISIFAMMAVSMARKEEREKAVNALKTILSACNDCKDFYSVQCGTCCIIDKFKELLNK
jgi:hypothetical protein